MSAVEGKSAAPQDVAAPRRPYGRWLLFGFAFLLALSHLVRWASPEGPEPQPEPNRRVVELSEWTAEGDAPASERGVRVALWDVRRKDESTAEPDGATPPAVLLLHGSPGRGVDFAGVMEGLGALHPKRRVLAPDLPGFGDSEKRVADYSARAHARYVAELFDESGIERAHVVGFSLGGAVGLELAALAPERVASLTMLSATGVQELELFGDYHLNHALHGFQLAGLWALYELVPHFGAFDGGMLSVAYARNFYDTDQRPLRAILEELDVPTLVLHGADDVLVPYAAAREHARIVPQSRLVTLEGNHFLVFRRSGEVTEHLAAFFGEVEDGAAPSRAEATPERLASAAEPFDPASVEPYAGLALVLFLFLAAAGTLVSEDLTCIAVGALIGDGRVDFLPGVAACFLGIYVGDILLFLTGRVIGRRALERGPLRYFLTPERVEHSSQWFERRGPVVIFLSRFLPGMRLPTYFASGVLRTSFWRFSFWFALAAALWTPILVWISSRIGGALSERVELLRSNLGLLLVATLAVGFVLVKVVRPMTSYRGRRLLGASVRRWTRWEYWPRWLFYPPIVAACGWFGLRRRSLLAFSAVNPGMPHGGFVGESKSAILRELGDSAHATRTLVLPRESSVPERVSAARSFQSSLATPWPLVLKPDVGERGDGVHVVRTAEELEDAAGALAGDTLVQEFVPGVEFGLFYARHPGEPRGRLISVARKILPEVVGDGARDLERLILDDPRAVCHADDFLARFAERTSDVPADGERVALGDLGTHCRGALFAEGADLCSPALEGAVDALASGFEGFHFGRFDVRSESDEALARGEFRVLELNGVTSESAHVYDPRYSVLDGWRTLIGQWGLAYEIGAANAERGARTSGVGDLVRAFLDARRGRAATLASSTQGNERVLDASGFEVIPAAAGPSRD